MLQHSEPDDYVVATGKTHSVQDFVEAAFVVVDLPPEKYLKQDASFERPTEPAKLVGSPTKIRRVLGWKPQNPLAVAAVNERRGNQSFGAWRSRIAATMPSLRFRSPVLVCPREKNRSDHQALQDGGGEGGARRDRGRRHDRE